MITSIAQHRLHKVGRQAWDAMREVDNDTARLFGPIFQATIGGPRIPNGVMARLQRAARQAIGALDGTDDPTALAWLRTIAGTALGIDTFAAVNELEAVLRSWAAAFDRGEAETEPESPHYHGWPDYPNARGTCMTCGEAFGPDHNGVIS